MVEEEAITHILSSKIWFKVKTEMYGWEAVVCGGGGGSMVEGEMVSRRSLHT